MVISRKNLIFDIIFTICSTTQLKNNICEICLLVGQTLFITGKEVKTYADIVEFAAEL